MSHATIRLSQSNGDGRVPRVLAFYNRTPRIISFSVGGVGLNLHRMGGVAITGLPRSGGSTICWGELRRRCERFDREFSRDEGPFPDAWVYTTGRFMIRIGKDF